MSEQSIDVPGRLAAMDEAWRAAPEEPARVPLPEGNAQFRVDSFDFRLVERTGHLNLVTKLEVVSHDVAEAIGRTRDLWHDLEDPERLSHVKKHVAILGVTDVEPFSTLQDRLNDALDNVVEGVVKHTRKGDRTFDNVYLNRRLEGVKAARADQAEPAATYPASPSGMVADDDDIPF